MGRWTRRHTFGSSLGNHIPVAYVIAPGWDGPCKIGITNNLQRRLTALQTSSWEPLSIFGFRVGVWRDSTKAKVGSTHAAVYQATRALEAAAHKALTDCELRLSGEWFDVTADEAKQVLEKCGQIEGIVTLNVERLAAGLLGGAAISETATAQDQILRSMLAHAAYVAMYQPHLVDKARVKG